MIDNILKKKKKRCFVTENYGTVRLFIFAVLPCTPLGSGWQCRMITATLDSSGNFERNVAKFSKDTERILQMLGITFIE